MVNLRSKRIEDNADKRLEVVDESEGDANVGMAMDKVGSAVNGVAHESRCGGEVHSGMVSFFAEEAVNRVNEEGQTFM